MMGVHNPMAAGGAVAGVAMAGLGHLGHAAIKGARGRARGGAAGSGGFLNAWMDPDRNRQRSNTTRQRIGKPPIAG